jgi:hypothetical protein
MTFLFSGSLLRYVGYRRRIDYETATLAAAFGVLFSDYPDRGGAQRPGPPARARRRRRDHDGHRRRVNDNQGTTKGPLKDR